MEKLGEACASTTLTYVAHSILCVNNLFENASFEQNQRYLLSLVRGEKLGRGERRAPAPNPAGPAPPIYRVTSANT